MSIAISDVRKNLALFADGTSYVGDLSEFNAPKLTETSEDFRGGAMDAPIEIRTGMEKLNTDWSVISFPRQMLGLWGLAVGQSKSFTVREALQSEDGTVTAVVHTMTGRITAIDPGTSKAGTVPECKFTLNLSYYKMTHGGSVVHEIDVVNFIRIINGTDVLSTLKNALNLS